MIYVDANTYPHISSDYTFFTTTMTTQLDGIRHRDGKVRCVCWDLHFGECNFDKICEGGCSTGVCWFSGRYDCYQCKKEFYSCGDCLYEDGNYGYVSCLRCVNKSGHMAYPPEKMTCDRCHRDYSSCRVPGTENEKVCQKCDPPYEE